MSKVCACDPTYRGSTFVDEDCDEDLCWGFNLFVTLAFLLATIWIMAVAVQSFRMGIRRVSIKEVMLLLTWVCCFGRIFLNLFLFSARVVRYGLLLNKDISKTTNYWLALVLSILHTVTIVIGVSLFTFLVYLW